MGNKLAWFGLWVVVLFIFQACTKEEVEPEEMPPDMEEVELRYPQKSMRGVWMATVWELDWPQGNYDVEAQKKLYTDYLDQFEALNINAIFFQIRGMGDAYYDSPYEPWSQSITGV